MSHNYHDKNDTRTIMLAHWLITQYRKDLMAWVMIPHEVAAEYLNTWNEVMGLGRLPAVRSIN